MLVYLACLLKVFCIMAQKKSLLLRLDPSLWEEINAWAAQDLRSVNAQIEFIIREAVRKHRKNPAESNPPDSDSE